MITLLLLACAPALKVGAIGIVTEVSPEGWPMRAQPVEALPPEAGRLVRLTKGGEETLPLVVGMVIKKGDTLVAGDRTVIATRAGRRFVLDLYPDSRAEFGSLSIWGRVRAWYYGSWAYARGLQPAPITTPGGGEVGHEGTDFLVYAPDAGRLDVIVLEGTVTVRSTEGRHESRSISAGWRGGTRGGAATAPQRMDRDGIALLQRGVNSIQLDLLGDEARVHPPPLVGLGCDDAMAVATAAGFRPSLRLKATPTPDALDTVLDQDPPHDQPTTPAADIDVTCAAATVPSLAGVGMTFDKARRELEPGGLVLAYDGRENPAQYPRAVVIAQDPEKNTLLRKGGTVEVKLGFVLDLVGRSDEEARALTSGYGVRATFTDQGPAPADAPPEDLAIFRGGNAIVVATSPPDPVPLGAVVTVSTRGPDIEVPDFTQASSRPDAAAWPALKVSYLDRATACRDAAATYAQEPAPGSAADLYATVIVQPCGAEGPD